MKYIKFLILGILFGLILMKTEAISWFRIQEMFRFQSFHMYGIIGSAVLVGMISLQVIKRLKLKSIHGEPIVVPDKQYTHGMPAGGLIFGMGWAMTGACPGPLFAQAGIGYTVMFVAILSAILGTYVYSSIRLKLPH
jgi:uncharacterized protein